MPPLSIVFCGTPKFACPSLQALANDPAFKITHVITQPDKPTGRKQEMTAPPVKILAEKLGIPVLQPKDINSQFSILQPSLKLRPAGNFQFRPDFLIAVAYGQILSQELLRWPKIAPINVHASLLPHFRGASPIHHAILAGEKDTGVTIQRMAEKLDTGPILAQERVSIDPCETFITLHDKLSNLGASLLIETLKKALKEIPQNETEATFCSKLTRERGVVDPKAMTAEEIDRHVRALVPWPGVRMSFSSSEPRGGESRSHDVKLLETSLTPHADALELSCANGTTLFVLKMQSPGKNAMTGKEWGHGTGAHR